MLYQAQDDGIIHPIVYGSHSVQTHEWNYGIAELETLGFLLVVLYFSPNWLGHPCSVSSDHAACLSILTCWPSEPHTLGSHYPDDTPAIKHVLGKMNIDAVFLCLN